MLVCMKWLDRSAVELTFNQQRPSCLISGIALLVAAALRTPSGRPFFDGHIRSMVYSYLHNLDPMTATRPLEDDQPLGAVQSHRVIFNAAGLAGPSH
jgi:hypothetical protein